MIHFSITRRTPNNNTKIQYKHAPYCFSHKDNRLFSATMAQQAAILIPQQGIRRKHTHETAISLQTAPTAKGTETIRKLCETADLFALGGFAYGLIEVLWRGYTHWSMVALGGALFLLLGALNSRLPQSTPLLLRGLLGGTLITAAELAAGCVLNLLLCYSVWDYSALPFQLLGQICLPYSLLWTILSLLAMPLYSGICRYGWPEAESEPQSGFSEHKKRPPF